MRAKRAKQYRKLMKQYELSFNFREPYQVLLDSHLIISAARFKMNLGKMLENTLSGAIKPMITQCTIRHLYNLSVSHTLTQSEKDSYITVAKSAERRRCGHHELEQPLSTLDCLLSVVDPKDTGTNKHRYVVASQDREIRQRIREIAGVPLVYVKRSVMILEPMARKTVEVVESEERGKIRAGLKGRRGVVGDVVGVKRKRDEEDGVDEGEDAKENAQPEVKRSKARGPKGPNPLSVKKAKKDKSQDTKTKLNGLEEELVGVRKAAKKDPQAAEKALDVPPTTNGAVANDTVYGVRKRKRKRKGKDEDGGVGTGTGTGPLVDNEE